MRGGAMYIHKNQGTFFKERNGVWYVNTIIDGKRIRKSLQIKDKRVAQKNFFEFLQRPIEKKTHFSDVLTFLLQEKSHRLKSFDVFRYHAKVVNDALGDQLVHTVSEMVIREFVNVRLKLKRRPATINRELSIIKQTLELAVLQGYIPSIPRIPRLSETGNVRQGFFTDEEMRRLLPYLPEYLRDFTLFAYLMGWRKSEIASLTWSDFDGVCLRLRDSKTGEQRVLPLNAGLSALIERRWQARCGTFIFTEMDIQSDIYDEHGIRLARKQGSLADYFTIPGEAP
jgi:integrase